ncbi:MAG: hypothetical protein Kow0079_17900 [Vicingaceae bacterium]|jgi:predicted DNA-binding protein (UPF0251 family)
MSPRLKILRKVSNPPLIKGFKPYGTESGNQNLEIVNLLYEEYEALRLSDYDILNHHQASVMMGVSRPTFTRIYDSALKKIAKAFVEGKQISIEGGKVYFDSDWYHCRSCNCYFNNPEKDKKVEFCPLCKSRDIENYNAETLISHDICICPNCGYEVTHKLGKPCREERCPQCHSYMYRKSK